MPGETPRLRAGMRVALAWANPFCTEVEPVKPIDKNRLLLPLVLALPWVTGLGCIATAEAPPEDEGTVAEAEQMVCLASYDQAIMDARALITANCGAISACGGSDATNHNDLQLTNGSYCNCYDYMWSNRNSYPWNSLQVIYHEAGACSWPHIHLKTMNACGYFHFDLDEGYDAATGQSNDGDCWDDEPNSQVDKFFCSTGARKGTCDDGTGGGPGPCSTTPLSVPNDRWRLRIYNNTSFDGGPVDVKYAAIGSGGFTFNWGTGSPSSCVGNDNFGIIFTRNAYFPTSATYTFTTTTDDGVRLFVDNSEILNEYYDQALTSHSASVYLTAGWHELKMRYYEHVGEAYAALTWSLGSNPYPNCPCDRTDNYCNHAPSTPGCPMTYPGGYCDPNGDASYDPDGDFNRGWYEYQDYCN
jgi:hypothetical protein